MRSGRVAIVGSNGQLGSDLVRVFEGDDVLALTHDDVDITEAEAVDAFVKEASPEVVVNVAAFHHTGKCEESPHQAFAVNAIGVWNVARACARSNSLLVHVSTDYVFDGTKRSPYVETDPVSPVNAYGVSKAAGELFVTGYCPKSYVVRSCGLYGVVPCRAKGGNFITSIRSTAEAKGEVRVVDDEIVTPTWTYSLARQIKRLCREQPVAFGLVHATDEGQCSWYEFAEAIFELTGTSVKLRRASVEDYPSVIRRPRYSVLENAVLNSAGANVMQPWRESLAEYLKLVA